MSFRLPASHIGKPCLCDFGRFGVFFIAAAALIWGMMSLR